MVKEHSIIKRILFILVIIFLIVGYFGIDIYRKVYKPNVKINSEYYEFYIKTGSSYEQVIKKLKEANILKNYNTFLWATEKKNYPRHVKPGYYRIRNRMTNNQLVNMLRGGLQTPVNVTFKSMRSINKFAELISKQIEAGSQGLIDLMKNDTFLVKFGFNSKTVYSMFIPNTYEFYWNTNDTAFFKAMFKQYKKFWNKERTEIAKKVGLSAIEISTLASIVNEETRIYEDMPRIAGVYINRLNRNMALQADPTIKFAIGNFSGRRVLNIMKKIDSPYNTYKYSGLPPGPIRIPSIAAIDAVLCYEKHDYLYFCAKPGTTGHHAFAKTYQQHLENAQLYHRWLNKKRIYK